MDRCDYLLRDAHATGVRYGVYDLDWLLRSLRFAPQSSADEAPALAIDGAKGLPAIEAFITARLFMFQQVYLHKATRAAEWMIRSDPRARPWTCCASAASFSPYPRRSRSAARQEPIALGDYLELDDGVLWGAMHAWEGASDRPLADLARRIRARVAVQDARALRGAGDHAGPARRAPVARDVARSRGLDPDAYVGLDTAADEPLGGQASPLMVVYAKGPARPLHEVSFLLGRLAGQSLQRIRLVLAPELREPVAHALGF